MWLKKLGMNTVCELPHQTFLHTHRKLVQTLPWALSMHKNIRMFKKLPLFMSSSRRRGYYDYDYGYGIMIMDNIHSITSQKIQTWAVGIFWTVWLCLTYPWYWRHMQLNCQFHFPQICQQQPCFPQLGMAASWSYPALRDMNWPSEAGCLLQTSDGTKIKIQNKALIFAVN